MTYFWHDSVGHTRCFYIYWNVVNIEVATYVKRTYFNQRCFGCMVFTVQRHFQQYVSYIVVAVGKH